jgi:hypothetical protein
MAEDLKQVDSMADLDDDDSQDDSSTIVEGDGTEKPEKARVAAAKKAEEDAKPKPDDKKDGDKGEKTDEKKDDEPVEIGYFEAVDQLTGRKIEVEYGEVDPESPEGGVLREKAVEAYAIAQYEAALKEKMPRAWDFYLHVQSGKPEKEFFEAPSFGLPDLEQFNGSVDIQKQVLIQDLLLSGLSQRQADAVVEKAIADKTLTEDATTAYNKRQAEDKAKREASEKRIQESEVKFQTDMKELGTQVAKVVKEDMKNIIPEAKQKDFMDFIVKNLDYTDEGFLVTLPIKGDTLTDLIRGLYVMHTKANLQDAINMGVKHAKVRALKKVATGGKPIPNGAEGNEIEMTTLADIFGDNDE